MSERAVVVGYKPYPPTNDAQVHWVKTNIVAVQMMATRPHPQDQENRKAIGVLLTGFFLLYPPLAGKLDAQQANAAAARQKIAADAFLEDLSSYPAWAVGAGLAEYRKSPEGKWPPKVSGEILPFIGAAYTASTQVLKNCRRILEANARGLNVDQMAAELRGLPEGQGKAETALDMMGALERSCDVLIDPVARDFYNVCHETFHTWRKTNAKTKKDDETPGTGGTDRDIFPPDPVDEDTKI